MKELYWIHTIVMVAFYILTSESFHFNFTKTPIPQWAKAKYRSCPCPPSSLLWKFKEKSFICSSAHPISNALHSTIKNSPAITRYIHRASSCSFSGKHSQEWILASLQEKQRILWLSSQPWFLPFFSAAVFQLQSQHAWSGAAKGRHREFNSFPGFHT